jgi:riboflavin kinase/FMN adenylyltransferase
MKIKGTVIKGKQKGQGLGFPTVNIEYENGLASGVYSGKVNFQGKEYQAAIFYGNNKKIIEAHLLDFSGDLYGQEIEIEIEKKIREVIRFENIEELKKQIAKDIEQIKILT